MLKQSGPEEDPLKNYTPDEVPYRTREEGSRIPVKETLYCGFVMFALCCANSEFLSSFFLTFLTTQQMSTRGNLGEGKLWQLGCPSEPCVLGCQVLMHHRLKGQGEVRPSVSPSHPTHAIFYSKVAEIGSALEAAGTCCIRLEPLILTCVQRHEDCPLAKNGGRKEKEKTKKKENSIAAACQKEGREKVEARKAARRYIPTSGRSDGRKEFAARLHKRLSLTASRREDFGYTHTHTQSSSR